uniref:Uncharacterized protein n=1 Tax=Glossina pallidipes TaxID=7398 RepID=A0A1A9ZXP8_GLOPL
MLGHRPNGYFTLISSCSEGCKDCHEQYLTQTFEISELDGCNVAYCCDMTTGTCIGMPICGESSPTCINQSALSILPIIVLRIICVVAHKIFTADAHPDRHD